MTEAIGGGAAGVAGPADVMAQMMSGFWVSRGIYVAAKLGVADYMREGARPVGELAEATGAHAPSLFRVMRMLAAAGVFEQVGEDRFGLTPISETLVTDAPNSLRAMATVQLGGEHFDGWANLLHSVKTGGTAFDERFGMDVWRFYEQNPENAKNFNDALAGASPVLGNAVVEAYDFSPFGKVVDVGGGKGSQLAAILKAYEGVRGVLYDAPSVVESAREYLAAEGVAERCEAVGGDFFESVPEGDAYVLRWIIHDWDDERSLKILRNIHRASKGGARVLLVESVVPANGQPHMSKFMDVNMLVMTGGRERTEAEYRALLSEAGFRLTRVVPTKSFMSVVEAVREGD
jgi:hypothetical protein